MRLRIDCKVSNLSTTLIPRVMLSIASFCVLSVAHLVPCELLIEIASTHFNTSVVLVTRNGQTCLVLGGGHFDTVTIASSKVRVASVRSALPVHHPHHPPFGFWSAVVLASFSSFVAVFSNSSSTFSLSSGGIPASFAFASRYAFLAAIPHFSASALNASIISLRACISASNHACAAARSSILD